MRPIDADALKAVFEEKSSVAVCGAELCIAIISRIDEAPTLDVQPVRNGKWIELNDDVHSCECSACGHKYSLYEDDIYGYPYCAKCGARMDVERKEENDDRSDRNE